MSDVYGDVMVRDVVVHLASPYGPHDSTDWFKT